MSQLIATVALPAEPDADILRGPHVPEFLRDETLADLLEASAAREPNHIALIFGDRQLSYRDLNQQADLAAARLTQAGLGPGRIVGLWLPRGIELLVMQAAITKTGAAWLPFDEETPVDRLMVCLADAAAAGLVTCDELAPRLERRDVTLWSAEQLLAPNDAGILATPRPTFCPEDPAYVIYTSGSTGTPKGIVVTQRSICHFLRSENSRLGVRADDVVYQGFSVAFDMSFEEIWIAYLVGATLWVAPKQLVGDVEALPDQLASHGVTVLHAVPTLLSLFARDVASLRLINLGGEMCPESLVAKWVRPGRQLFNSYGPTEATVTASLAPLQIGVAVTIGTPLPNYDLMVIDADDESEATLLPRGQIGELCISGPGLAQGYLGRPDLTAVKFLPNPWARGPDDARLYRTGDLARIDATGQVVCLGRSDGQVKIRGFRVELGEIETLLTEQQDVGAGAVLLRQEAGLDQLVAYVVPRTGGSVTTAALRHALRQRLPPYMVPARFEILAALPRLASGKIDRNSLQTRPLPPPLAVDDGDERPANAIEAALLAALKALLPGQPIDFDADFFLDLGGHSLIAARFVSLVRKTAGLAGLTLNDVYRLRSLRAMAALLAVQDTPPPSPVAAFAPPPLLRRFCCGLAQALCLPLIVALTTAPWLGVFVVYQLFTGEEHNFLLELEVITATYAGINLIRSLFSIAAKWLIIGRTKPGSYPLWGVYYFRWWLTRQLLLMINLDWFKGTSVMRVLLRALGAKIGDDAIFSDINVGAIDLIEIGAGTALGAKVQLANAEVIGDRLVIGTISIGANVSIGSSCVLEGDTRIGDGAELADLTAVASGLRIPAWERWEGSPARCVGQLDEADQGAPAVAGRLRRAAQFVAYGAMLAILPSIVLIPILPAFYILDSMGDLFGDTLPIDDRLLLPLFAWPAAMVLILVTVLLIAAIRWTVLPRMRPGRSSVHSWFYVRKCVVSLATELTLDTLYSLFATVYMRNWYRLLGVKIGKDTEISTNLGGSYDLIEIGARSFIADEAVIGDEDVRNGWMTLKPVRTAQRVFIGNSAVVPPGADIPSNTLIGIKTRPPADNSAMQEGGTWFGSPPQQLPVRQRFDQAHANWTYEPSRRRRLARAVFEAFSLSFPTMLAITFGTISVDFLAPAILGHDFATLIPLFVLCSTSISIGLTLSAIAVKWLMMGVYRPTTKPMWSWWALRTEAIAVNYVGLSADVLLDHLRGTPFLPWVLRLFGCKFGQGVYLDATDITEFDCVSVGDFAAINGTGPLQTHLYEDRVMKTGRIEIGKGVTISSGTTVLYDTKIGDFARLGPLTIVMKGEEIPAFSHWLGSPAQPIEAISVSTDLRAAA
jgi:non-ribosomal peptide synthetase-like protein